MNKRRIMLCVFALSALILLAGCADKGTLGQSNSIENSSEYAVSSSENSQTELVPITSVQDTFSEDTGALRTQTFDNMSLADTHFTFPNADKVHILEYNITDFDISPDDAYDYMCRRLDELFPGMFGNEEKASEIRFYDV
ncbi:MAG: hypothetical protein HDR72_04155, partial [Ruminococcaceae bacterium]|nr:hypothetical protein [Oscillospiraceae bacterium]